MSKIKVICVLSMVLLIGILLIYLTPKATDISIYSADYIQENLNSGMQSQTIHFSKNIEDSYLLIPPDKVVRPIIHPIEVNASCEKEVFAQIISEISSKQGIDTDIRYASTMWDRYINNEEFEYFGYTQEYFWNRIHEECDQT